jgi:hypothetical protein
MLRRDEICGDLGRDAADVERVDFAIKKIHPAGKVVGTRATSDQSLFWLDRGVQCFYVHPDPFHRTGRRQERWSDGRSDPPACMEKVCRGI